MNGIRGFRRYRGFAPVTARATGLLETVYREALALELGDRAVPFTLEAPLPVHYKGQRLHSTYRVDVVCFDSVLVEVKALAALSRIEEA